MRRSLIASIFASGCLLFSSHTLAVEIHQYPECRKQPSDTDIQGAKGAFQAGSVSFNEADYERAILYWEDAFRRDCTATLLLHHLARAYEGQGNLRQAVVALRAYLERTPDAAERPQIQRRIEVFEQKLQEEEQRAAKVSDEQKTKDATAPSVAGSSGNLPSSGVMDFRVNPVIPMVVGGVGVAATIVGAIVYFPAQSDLSDYEARCPNGVCTAKSIENEAQSAQSRRNWGAAVGVTGLVLALGGTGWYFLNPHMKWKTSTATPAHPARALAAKSTEFQPWVGPQVAGLSIRGEF